MNYDVLLNSSGELLLPINIICVDSARIIYILINWLELKGLVLSLLERWERGEVVS